MIVDAKQCRTRAGTDSLVQCSLVGRVALLSSLGFCKTLTSFYFNLIGLCLLLCCAYAAWPRAHPDLLKEVLMYTSFEQFLTF